MKLPGTLHLALKIYFISLALLTMNFHAIIQGTKTNFVTIAKERISNEQLLLNRIKDAINDEDLENASSYFDISDFNTSFPKSQSNGTIFFLYGYIIFMSQL